MSRPLFEVGEEVTLISDRHPSYNGDYFVIHIRTGWCSRCSKQYGYRLTVTPPDLEDYSDHWCEHNLRKKPKPGGDFDELLKELDKPLVREKVKILSNGEEVDEY